MSESGDYDPAYWKGHDFGSARSAYDAHAGRSYAAAVAAGKTVQDLIEPTLTTQSPSPLLISTDVTGSMGEWPPVLFSKLPYLELEGQTYLGKEMEIAWLANGDAHEDQYGLQVRPFAKGLDLAARLKEIAHERGGGGPISGAETYELVFLYLLHKASMPKAKNPILIIIGDETPYPTIPPQMAKIAGVATQETLKTEDIVKALKKKMAIYLVRKAYPGLDVSIWNTLIGEDHIADLDDPSRVVDVIFGILAKETGRINEFRDEIEGRQTKAQVDTVYRSLKTIHKISGKTPRALPAHGKSVMHTTTGTGKKPKDLL